MNKKKIMVLGAGLTGLSVAWHLQKKGIECRVFEKEAEAGGLCRSKAVRGFTFDYDGHLLHFKHKYAFGLVKKLLKGNLLRHRRNAKIFFQGRYINYPFQANLYGLKPAIAEECLGGFIKASGNGKLKKNSNFLEWINATFGPGIARHFMVPYNTKFWTLPPEKLSSAWVDGLIPVPSLRQAVSGAKKENKKRFGYNAQFWYPKKGGIGALALAFSRQIKNIRTACPVIEIDPVEREITLASGKREHFDYLVSTIPLPELSFLIRDLPKGIIACLKKLKWNSIFNLNLGIDRKPDTEPHWIYFPGQDTCFFRIGFFHNFSSGLVPAGKSSIYAEVAYAPDNPPDKDKLVSRIKADLKASGMLSGYNKIECQDVNDIKYGYPIYDNNYFFARKSILQFLRRNLIFSCGRYGGWRYSSMGDDISEGREIAQGFKRFSMQP